MAFVNKYQKGFAGLFVLLFLSVSLVAAAYVVNSGKFNFNPNEDAAMTCQGTCYRANLCDSLDRYSAVGTCYSGYVCCGGKIGGTSTSTPAPTKTPTPRPIPTSACNRKGLLHVCHVKSSSEKECMNEAIQTFGSLGWDVVPNCCSLVDCAGANENCYACYVTRIYPTPTPSIQVVKITSGTCSSKCVAIKGTCLNVGTNSDGNNGKIMSWGNYTSCVTRIGTCNSTITKLPSGTTTCSGTLPEWTKCRCKINPYAN